MKRSLMSVAATTFAAALALNGCGGGGSGDVPAETKTIFDIDNNTRSNFSSLAIQDAATGAVIEQGAVKCAPRQVNCYYYYAGNEMAGPVNLLFKDAQNRTVAAYVVAKAPRAYQPARVDAATTGLFLLTQLDARYPEINALSEGQYEARLGRFTLKYDSPDGLPHYDEEIAAYYWRKLQTTQMTLDEFYAHLGPRLINFETAGSDEFEKSLTVSEALPGLWHALRQYLASTSSVNPIGVAHAQALPSNCSALVQVFFKFAGAAAGGVKYAFPTGGAVMEKVGGLSTAVCGDPTKLALRAIMDQLNQIQSQLDSLHDKLGVLTNMFAEKTANEQLQAFADAAGLLERLGSNYETLLHNNQVSSLTAYVAKYGGSDQTTALTNALRNETFKDIVKGLNKAAAADNYRVQIERLTGAQLNDLTSALKTLCYNPDYGDLYKQRIRCNLAIATTASKLLAAQQIALRLAKDTYELASAYKGDGNGLTELGLRNDIDPAKEYSGLEASYRTQMDALINAYKAVAHEATEGENKGLPGGYYNVYQGLADTLLSNMKAVSCFDPKTDRPAIHGWSRSATEEFLLTHCSEGSLYVQARYFLKAGGKVVAGTNDPANIMGVPIPANNRRPGDSYTPYRSALVWVIAQKGSFIPRPNTFLVNNENRQAEGSKVVPPSLSYGPAKAMQLWQTNVSGDKVGLSATPVDLFTIWDPNKSGDYVYNWVRFTDSDSFSYVFYIADGGGRDMVWIYFYCVTDDCTPGQDPYDFINLEFAAAGKKLKLALQTVGTISPPPRGEIYPSSPVRSWSVNGKLLY